MTLPDSHQQGSESMARRRRRRRDPENSDEFYQSSRDDRMDRRRVRRGTVPRKWLILGGLLLLFVYFLPSIVVRTPLKQVAINSALSKFKGKVTVGQVECGWINNTRLSDVVAKDEDGEVLFTAESVRVPKSLTSMWGAKDFGKIVVLNPTVNLRLRHDGSNLEDAIAELIKSDGSDGGSVGAQITIENGAADVIDEGSGGRYQLSGVNSTIDLNQDELPPLNAVIAGVVTQASGEGQGSTPAGTFEANLQVDEGQAELTFSSGAAQVSTDKIPLEFVGPILTRFVEPMQLTGTMSGSANLTWIEGGAGIDADIKNADFKNLRVAAPGWIGNDQIALRSAWLSGKVQMTPGWLDAEDVEFRSEVANVTANGRLDWQQLAVASNANIPANDLHAEGTIQLAQLTTMLPETLRLQKDLKIESGTIEFSADSKVEGEDRRLVVNVESAGLTAIKNESRFSWQKPARVVATVRQTKDNHTLLDSLLLSTNFLTVSGSATKVAGEFTVDGDLEKASRELQQVFDLGGIDIKGKIDGKLGWRFDGNANDTLTSRPLNVVGRFRILQPLIKLPGQPVWSEEDMDVVLEASGQMLAATTLEAAGPPAERQVRIDNGKLELVNAHQRLEANLIEPMMNPSLNSNWKLACKVEGDIQSWLTQIQTFSGFQVNAGGTIEANAQVFTDLQNLYLRQAKYKVTNFQMQDFGLTIEEPSIEGEGDVDILLSEQRIVIPGLSLRAAALGANASDYKIDFSDQFSMDGQVAFIGDVNRLILWLGPVDPAAVQWYGQVQGAVDMKAAGQGIDGKIDLNFSDLVAQRRATAASFQNASTASAGTASAGTGWVRLLEEKQATLISTLKFGPSFDRVEFQDLKLNSSVAQVVATGEISDLAGTMQTNAKGTWDPNWELLKPLVDSYVGRFAEFSGVKGGQFEVRGPVFNPQSSQASQANQSWLNPQLQIQSAASWQAASVLGLPVGGASVNVQVADGIAAADTGAIPFSNGQVRLSPRLDMRGPQMMLSMVPGTVVEQVRLTPDICRGWVKFVAPILADATAVEGNFSVATSAVNVPLSNPTMGQVQGVATLHGANVGPGPLGQKLMAVVSQVKALSRGEPLTAATQSQRNWLVMPEQQVQFKMEQGRVYHQALQFQVDDVIIQTTGSVGLDQTMEMTAYVPVQDSWVGDSRWTQGLKGQTLQIPISGTVSNPRLDSSIVQRLSTQLLQSAASSAVNNEVQGLINKGNDQINKEVMKGLGRLLGGDR